jgi:hypothetical protein
MPLVVALWLALLQALSLAAPARPAGVEGASPSARVEQAGPTGRRVAIPHPGTPAEALPAGARVAADVLVRSGGPPPVGGAGPLAALPVFARPGLAAAAVARRALRRHGGASHAIAARGGVLPYFPTAPPIQG